MSLLGGWRRPGRTFCSPSRPWIAIDAHAGSSNVQTAAKERRRPAQAAHPADAPPIGQHRRRHQDHHSPALAIAPRYLLAIPTMPRRPRPASRPPPQHNPRPSHTISSAAPKATSRKAPPDARSRPVYPDSSSDDESEHNRREDDSSEDEEDEEEFEEEEEDVDADAPRVAQYVDEEELDEDSESESDEDGSVAGPSNLVRYSISLPLLTLTC